MTIQQYIENIQKRYQLGNATEHTFRGDLQQLLESLVPSIRATNEPKRQSCGAPDYILTQKDIPVGFIEAKDIGDKDLTGEKKTGNKEQFDRYKASLNNLIFTDYLRFYLYRDGVLVTHIAIGEITEKGISPLTENFGAFENLIKDFCTHIGQTIKSSKKLAEMMAGKARLLSDIIGKALTNDEEKHENSSLKDQMNAFREILIHDISAPGFADVYAQTITYGMFAARLHDPTLQTFSRQEAAELIPKSNPFLRKLFQYIAGYDLDDRIRWVVDDLVQIFLACNVDEMLRSYGKSTKMEDPIIHFYEDFLSEYDPKLRKARGVWYTPHPVVSFQVRAIDDILKTEFGLSQGLADISKTKIKVNVQGKMVEQEVHRVQLLDPATGTGTYIAEVIKHIYQKFQGQQGIWSQYVENHLLPRLIGFELLMASYAMAHLQIDLLLKETGYKPTKEQRLKIYLTNSLEESHPDTGTLFANWLSTEANEANFVKRDAPVMIVMGNPPYSGESANKGEWIMKLMEDYKKEPGGKEKLNERNPKWINDDYVKFLRYGQHFIEKNGSGILAFINPHGFLDNPTFRGMRWNLLKTYDKIYTIDLHGNSKKKETAPDGSVDINVFDIQQGVSINIFVKTGHKKAHELGKVFHYDVYGKREFKYDFLSENHLNTIPFKDLPNVAPNYFFVSKDFEEQKSYDKGFSVSELFSVNNVGIVTSRDSFVIDDNKLLLEDRIKNFFNKSKEELHIIYGLRENSSWKVEEVQIKAKDFDSSCIKPVSYRPFDSRYIYYNDYFIERSRTEVMQHFIKGPNVGLVTPKINQEDNCYFISKNIIAHKLCSAYDSNSLFPLYLYPDNNPQQTINQTAERIPNLNTEIVKQIAERLGLAFVPEKGMNAPLNLPKGETSKGDTRDAISPPLEGSGEATPRYQTANAKTYCYTLHFQKEMKKEPTQAEKIMWERLRNKKTGYKIRRQHIIDDFIVDFVCLLKKLVIEIDGKIHLQQKEYDEQRTARLNELDFEVIRFTNEEVFANPDLVVSKINEKLDSLPDAQSENHVLCPPLDSTTEMKDSPPLQGTMMKDSPPLQGPGEAFAPIDILDYIYAVLHSPTYRETYKEFLKIDFPRIPFPKDVDTFWQLVKLGGEIRQIHLLESPVVEQYITQYPIDGDNVVEKIRFDPTHSLALQGRVYINDTQYFSNVPQVAWEFYIGGYQPAQKWLKDRKDRQLEFDDILHYQKIIVALTETDRLMREIDKMDFM